MYWFLDNKNQVLYVGKAKDIKKRLQAYKNPQKLNDRLKVMLKQVGAVHWQEQSSELEASFIEAELIRIHQPKFNILLKDDKSPLYVLITNETFPKVLKVRKPTWLREKNPQAVLGPFASSDRLTSILKLARNIFPWCNQGLNQDKPHQSKACFYYQLELCPGACCRKVSAQTYQKNIENLILFLRGKKKQVLTRLNQEIKHLAQAERFEEAGKLRNQIELMQEFTQNPTYLRPQLTTPALNLNQTQEGLLQLQHLLSEHQGLPKLYKLHRIEGYDASNLGDQHGAVSMVAFISGKPKNDQYRLFNVNSFKSDYDLLKTALKRRLRHPEWSWPNLLVIDGGKGQVRAACQTWSRQTPIIGLVKRPDRVVIPYFHTKSFLHDTSLKRAPAGYRLIKLPESHPTLKLLRQVRDESHRFAKRAQERRQLRELLPIRYI